MKNIIISIFLLSAYFTSAQNINWSATNDQQNNLVTLNFGYDFGLTTQLGYAHAIQLFDQTYITADYSFPMGKELLDDFKFRLGGQTIIYAKNNFMLSGKINAVLRRHETSLVRMVNLGADAALQLGLYKSRWHLATELGFDKAITTHLQHSEVLADNFSGITDGWYIPSGGHFYYGIQGSKCFGKRLELSLRLGATNAEGSDQDPLLPYYATLGAIWKIGKSQG